MLHAPKQLLFIVLFLISFLGCELQARSHSRRAGAQHCQQLRPEGEVLKRTMRFGQ